MNHCSKFKLEKKPSFSTSEPSGISEIKTKIFFRVTTHTPHPLFLVEGLDNVLLKDTFILEVLN